MIIVTNLNIAGLKLNDEGKLADLLCKALSAIGVKHNVKVIPGVGFNFHDIERGKVFLSSQENFIPMKETDPRIAKLGRNYLETNRLTKEQFEKMVDIITTTFPKMGISCQMEFQEFSDDVNSKYLLIDDKAIVGKLPTPGNFPLKKVA